MLNIINDLVEISKIESGHAEINHQTTNVNEQLRFVYEFFSPDIKKFEGAKQINLSIPETDTWIDTDPQKLITVLSNLINNAIKFSDSGLIEVGYTMEEDMLQFFVKDEGICIPEEKIDSVFDRFVQADTSLSSKYEGAGLGLSIAKAYTEMLGGNIWVKSKPGKGSVFFFTLPGRKQTPGNTKSGVGNSETENRIILRKLKVLIADDDQSSYDLLCIMLEDHAYEFLHAVTGRQAVNMVKAVQDIDLVFMDIKMPDMNGYEATRIIRELNKDIIIIAQTAYAMTGDRGKAFEAGCNNHITKPLRQKDLAQAIRKHFS